MTDPLATGFYSNHEPALGRRAAGFAGAKDDRDGRLKNGLPVTVLMEAIEASEAAASR